MRVLMLNHEYPPLGGGSGVATKNLAEALTGLGHEVLVLAAGADDRRFEEHGVGVRLFRCTARAGKLAGVASWLAFLRRGPAALRAALADFRPDVVHSHFLFPSGYVVARTGTEIPHVASTVGAEVHDPTRPFAADGNPIMRALIRRTARHARAVTTSARDLTARVRALFPEIAEIAEIPWPVPPLTAGAPDRSRLGLGDDRFVVSTLCRLVRRKRLDVLLEAVRRLGRDDVVAVVMGYGPLEDALRRAAEEMGIAGAVRFTGRVDEDDKAAYLAASDVFCLPSDHEGFGLVFVEAMSVGTPVIATDVGGQTDIVREGVDGFLVPRADPEAVARRIRTLRDDAELRARMSRAARERAREFAPGAVARRFAELYARVA